MRIFLLVSFVSAAIAITEDLFSTDPPPLGDSPFFLDSLDEYDSTRNSGGSDPTLSFPPLANSNSDSSQLELSSCQSENSDLISWSKVRARDGDICGSRDQSAPIKDVLPGWATRLGQSLLDKVGLSPIEEVDDDEEHFTTLINNWKCQPTYHTISAAKPRILKSFQFSWGQRSLCIMIFVSKVCFLVHFLKFLLTNWFIYGCYMPVIWCVLSKCEVRIDVTIYRRGLLWVITSDSGALRVVKCFDSKMEIWFLVNFTSFPLRFFDVGPVQFTRRLAFAWGTYGKDS